MNARSGSTTSQNRCESCLLHLNMMSLLKVKLEGLTACLNGMLANTKTGQLPTHREWQIVRSVQHGHQRLAATVGRREATPGTAGDILDCKELPKLNSKSHVSLMAGTPAGRCSLHASKPLSCDCNAGLAKLWITQQDDSQPQQPPSSSFLAMPLSRKRRRGSQSCTAANQDDTFEPHQDEHDESMLQQVIRERSDPEDQAMSGFQDLMDPEQPGGPNTSELALSDSPSSNPG